MHTLFTGVMSAPMWLLAQIEGATGANPGDGASEAAAAAAKPRTLWTYVQEGGAISYIMILLSVVALGLVIRNLIMLRLSRLAPRGIVSRLEELLAQKNLGGAIAFCREPENACFITSVMDQAITRAARSDFGMMEFRAGVEEAAQGEADELHRMNDMIGVIAAVGPMLGLLGTTVGMIGAFRTIGALEGAARSNELATFMSMALVNTAEGLIVAIPCTIAFSLFRRHVDAMLKRITQDLERLIAAANAPDRPAAAPRPMAPQGAGMPGGGPARAVRPT